MMSENGAAQPDVPALVRRYLREHQPTNVRIELVEGEIRREQDWWYVPVRPAQGSPKTFEYYTLLSEIEGDLEEKEHLNVMLVPAAPEE
jgi:hypothetical protein